MTDLEQFTQLPADFDGRVRLFPLPELVVFPNAMQPLHIFEPRYCEMLEDAMADDRLIAMATLANGWEAASGGAPAIAPHVCICRVISHSPTEDDRHNVLVVGLRRARIVEEEDTGRPFRVARVEVVNDIYPTATSESRQQLKNQLLDSFRQLIPNVAEVQKNLHELMASSMPLGPVTDIIAFTMQFEGHFKLALLSQADVDERAQLLIQILNERTAIIEEETSFSVPRGTPFPPPFSAN